MDLVFTLALSVLMMVIAWLLYKRLKNQSVADVFRPLTIFIVGTCHLFFQGWDHKSNMVFYMLALWGLRLSGFVFVTRIAQHQKDPRYDVMSQSWKDKEQGFLYLYILQGIFVWIITLPFHFIAKHSSYTWFDQLILLVVFIAILGEAIADISLYRFRQKGGKGVYQYGLWSYMRHPNYFFDWLVWLGFSILGIYDLSSIMSLFSCILLYFVLRYNRISLTERYLEALYPQEYSVYKARVPAFFPNFH